MTNHISIFCTIGPSSLNKKFLLFTKDKVDLLRINMSHVSINSLEKMIIFIRKYSKVPICIDTEGAQIRTKVKSKIKYKKNQLIKLSYTNGNFNLYPNSVYEKIKPNDIMEIGFEGLEAKVKKKSKNILLLTCTKPGTLETNKGVHVKNRNVKLDFLTKKDLLAIELAKKFNISNFALSFTNTKEDMIKFNNLLKDHKKIFKLETMKALKNFHNLKKYGNNFLIDRGDLSKSVSIEKIPLAQRFLFKKKDKKTSISVATNFLESMIMNPYPTRAEVNDIFNSLEMGASSLVLAAETAIGKHPIECIIFLRKMIEVFKHKNKISFK